MKKIALIAALFLVGCNQPEEPKYATQKELNEFRNLFVEMCNNVTDAVQRVDAAKSNSVANIYKDMATTYKEHLEAFHTPYNKRLDDLENDQAADRSFFLDKLAEITRLVNNSTNAISVREWYTEEGGKMTSVGPTSSKRHPIWVFGYYDSSNHWNSVIAYNKQAYTNLDNQLNGK
jgi:hypothetical protein